MFLFKLLACGRELVAHLPALKRQVPWDLWVLLCACAACVWQWLLFSIAELESRVLVAHSSVLCLERWAHVLYWLQTVSLLTSSVQVA